ncbi:MAG TPA: sigma 54-interacting transcriptional regulator [Bryobacteraceae bacterium]|nr:sigma 54-interacting transcriptional regulator [Bryobacteraceae bacterium]
MSAEIVIANGALAGVRLPLTSAEITIGRAPSSTLCLDSPGTAWHHCRILHENDRWRLRAAGGTRVNGLRVDEHVLEDGDQVAIGENILVFRSAAGTAGDPNVRPTLLRASALLFLFRTLARATEETQRVSLQEQIVGLIGALIPLAAGFVVLADSETELADIVSQRAPTYADIAAHAATEGSTYDEARATVAVPLYVRGRFRGVIITELPPAERERGRDHRDALTAVATIAAAALEGVHEIAALRAENTDLQRRLGLAAPGILGESACLSRLREMIGRVAPQDVTVLIQGETGTGKELVARALHEGSDRRQQPFLAINCASLTEGLLESELFGHEKGAFTGAVAAKRGKFEVAEGGTVFFDEIGELAPGLQAKLLRVIQEREFVRVGGTRTLRLDVRILAATNRDLAAEVKAGRFREDLFHRLNVIVLRTPPLREHREDIPMLARHFLECAARRCARRVAAFSPAAERALREYSWPGNVRELENAIERAVVLGAGEEIGPEDLPEAVTEGLAATGDAGAFQAQVVNTKRQSILRAWEAANGDYKAAARQLGMHPNSLLRLIRNLGLRELLPR